MSSLIPFSSYKIALVTDSFSCKYANSLIAAIEKEQPDIL